MLGKIADPVIPGTSLAPARGDAHAFALTSLAPIASTEIVSLCRTELAVGLGPGGTYACAARLRLSSGILRDLQRPIEVGPTVVIFEPLHSSSLFLECF